MCVVKSSINNFKMEIWVIQKWEIKESRYTTRNSLKQN